MSEISNNHEVAAIALAYFEGVKSDLLEFGGTSVTRVEPLKRSREFAVAVYDQLAMILARRYHNNEIDFETADWLANDFEGELNHLFAFVWPDSVAESWPMLWSEVYEAFDAGEHDHFGRSTDPIKEFTDPMIAEFLAKQI
ncbi:hypothetical protein [uncultured Erythrobacter sp.]|uniref:hypothetical protein n=1 Tax=uncultured Erythrobacter sp. TaxID=263913 RepID=UPI00262CEE49|nr:hypothetical protein [uncultured Erythrobacter sp.]